MFTCEYCVFLIQNKKPKKKRIGTFKTSSFEEAYKVIERWNTNGKRKNIPKIVWDYSILSLKQSSTREMDDKNIQFFDGGNC